MEITALSMPIAALLASLIGATATITAALLQLRIAWRKEMQARAEHKPVTRKSKRAPVRPVIVLMIASAIGGFLLAQYLASNSRAQAQQLEETLNRRIQQLDNMRQFGRDTLLQQLRLEEALRAGHQGVTAQLTVGRCVAGQASNGTGIACNEQQATQLKLCVELPAAVSVSGIELFARGEGETTGWEESKVTAGSDLGGARFSENHTERLLDENRKQVCQGLSHWNSQDGLQARLVVHYLPDQQPSPTSAAKP